MHNTLVASILSCGVVLGIVALSFSNDSFAQRSKQPALVCKKSVLAALKPRPELSYECDEQLQDWDKKILKLPARVAAIKTLTSELASFSEPAWWTADAVDLSVCDFTKQAGRLTSEQRHDFLQGEYLFWLFGNDPVRLVLIPDPCYQTQYGGSTAFLLYHDGNRVIVSQVLDGYFSRADNSVGLDIATLGSEQIVEISTGSGGLNPTLTSYYFFIDPHTKHAVPKNLFIGEHGPTNEITSAMLLEGGGASEPLKLVRGHTLAKSFIIYTDTENGKIQDSGRTLSRKVLRWSGKLYR